MNIKKCIGQRIKELRKGKGLSQEKLSEMANISQNALSLIEIGDNFFTSETLEKLITALEIEPEDLFKFKHLQPENDLLNEIIQILKTHPEKIQEIYKIAKALTI